MNEVFTAIYSHYKSDPLASSVLTGLYNTEAPSDAVFPYIVFSLVTNVPDIDSSQLWENYTLQFKIFSKKSSSNEIGSLFKLLKGDTAAGEGFDFLNLSIENYTTVVMNRKGAVLHKIEKVWEYTVLYELMTVNTGDFATEIFVGKLYCLMNI